MTISKRDKKYIWHPLVQHKLYDEMLAIKSAKGVILTDESGNAYIDGISSWYTAVYGHCNKFIISRVTEQMKQLDQVVFSGFTHEPAVRLSEALIDILPDNQEKLFFSDNGSTATEIGIKMALQYHFNKGNKRNILIAFEEGFHGDTFGAMSVSGLSVYNGPFEEYFIDVERIPVPIGENNKEVLSALKKLIAKGNIAGFVFEPIVQGAAAMKMHDTRGLDALIKLCKENDVITVADEVMTGFGKTGTYFASDHLTYKPDVICMSKALTAGLLPMAITSCTQKIFDAFYDDDIGKGLFHAHTYTANPLSCTAAIAGIELLKSVEIQENIKNIICWHRQFGQRIASHPKVKSVRQTGVIFALDLAVEMARYGNLRDRLYKFFMKNGVFLRPLGSTIYILAPYIITKEQMTKIYDVIEQSFEILE
ncbi:adenosylmethionine--8-amino-7-oxononanoate transaminase [Spongiivirga sp. MCCC 1A20706]|uniref:adenosylmethionine--8-amino-7-oxononanoate transaminase n=1 Tax=Spongiivirga sp. MCCC 1A20706 TaxID=3160963 RepID=UPI0039775FF6